MNKIPKIDIKPYLDVVFRRKWWVIFSLVAAIIAGAGYYKMSPKVYRASTLILVEPQKVPDDYVRPVVTGTIERRLHTITQQIHSRTNLEHIIERFNLEGETEDMQKGVIDNVKSRIKKILKWDTSPQAEKESLKKMNMVEGLRKNISVNLRGRGGNSAFEISVNWNDAKVAADVTNFVANKFIEENLNVREEMTMATTDFLDREASRIRYELEAKEKELEDFKKKHMGMLPSELRSNINILNQLKEELNNLEKRLDTEKQSTLMLERQMQQMKDNFQPDNFLSFEEENFFETGLNSEIDILETELKKLKYRYTDSHPDVIALKHRIESLREEMENQPAEPVPEVATDPLIDQVMNPADMISPQVETARNRIQSYEDQIREVKNQIETYKERVEGTPQVELAMTKILRDYETIKSRYDALLSKSLSARMAEELERRQKSEQFRIIDSAVAPVKPFSPDVRKIMLMAIMAGLALGCGMAYIREIMDPCFYDPDEIESALQTPVIVSLPIAEFKKKSMERKKKVSRAA